MADCREFFKKHLENTFISSQGSDEAVLNEMMSFLKGVLSIIPDKLYRYRKIDKEGHNINAFEKGTISLCKAKFFSDKYDSLIYVDAGQQRVLMEDSIKQALQGVLERMKQKSPLLNAEKASKLCYYLEQGMTEQEVIDRIIKEDYDGFLNEVELELKQRETRFRDSDRTATIACFTESVQSKYMWDTYADGYRGFALEYDLKEILIRCISAGVSAYVFPVIYTDKRPDLTVDEANIYGILKTQEHGQLLNLELIKPFLNTNLLSPYKPFLYKDKEEYGHEKEWRILHYDKDGCKDFFEIPDYGCLKAIYYGMDIKTVDYNKLHQIALNKGIKEYRVAMDESSRKYSLKITPL